MFIFVAGLIPGLGHMCLGKTKKAAALFIIFSGLITGFLLSDLMLIKALMCAAYCSIVVPGWLETYQIMRGRENKIDTDARWYTILLLLFTGFAAGPLLWQNKNFSRNSKICFSKKNLPSLLL